MHQSDEIRSRAQRCLLGQLIGDALGSLVEFQSPDRIAAAYPNGVRELKDGGTWNTIAGQPTDDSEMALALARCLVRDDGYNAVHVRRAYVEWLASEPVDCGMTVQSGLRGQPNPESQANGALMRVSPLGILGAREGMESHALEAAEKDAAMTHPHPVCAEANRVFVQALIWAIRDGVSADTILDRLCSTGDDSVVRGVLSRARLGPPEDFIAQQGWVLIALQNAFWQAKNNLNPEESLVDTIGQGGDTDTNAGICGALLGAIHGLDAWPERWVTTVLSCRPERGTPRVRRPRPEVYWPVDALDLADQLSGYRP